MENTTAQETTPGQRLIEVLREDGITQEDVSERTGLPIKDVESLFETGHMDFENFMTVIQAFDHLDGDYVLSGERTKKALNKPVYMDTDINARFKELRIKNNFTQEEMATEIGKKRATYASIEGNRHCPTIQDLRVVKRRFKVSYDWLLEGTEIDSKFKADAQRKIRKLENENATLRQLIKDFTIT